MISKTWSSKGSAPVTEDRASKIELLLAQVLRAGVIASATFSLFGLLLFFWRVAQGTTETRLSENNIFFYQPSLLWSHLLQADPIAFISLGVLFLVITPVIRVAASVFLFASSHDWFYVVVTLLVLGILMVGWFV